MKLRVLIVDDEPPARKKLRRFLQQHPEAEIVGEAEDGQEAVLLLEELKPDLVFLDIQMPRMNGFEVLEALQGKRPHLIFTTAYDQYAVQAFEVRALDYLLKPFDEDRFREAFQRATNETKSRQDVNTKIDDLLKELRSSQKYLRRILLKSEGRISFLPVQNILWIEAEEKYVRLHSGKESYLHRETMNRLEQQLDPASFVRVHRRYIVHLDFVEELQAWSHGDYMIVLKNGKQIPLGRKYREQFLTAFERN